LHDFARIYFDKEMTCASASSDAKERFERRDGRVELFGPLLAFFGGLILIGIGVIRLFLPGGQRWKQSGLCVGAGVLLLLLLTVFFWIEEQHIHRDSEGTYDDRDQERYQNKK
jgi:hypothetical protein